MSGQDEKESISILNNSLSWTRKVKLGVLTALAAGTMYGSACSMQDLRHNIIGGTLSFVEGYTGDLWTALVPSADEVINFRGDNEDDE